MGMEMKITWKGHPEIYYMFARQIGPHRKVDGKWNVPVRVSMCFAEGTEVLDMVGDYNFVAESDEDITYPNIYKYLHSLDEFLEAKAVL